MERSFHGSKVPIVASNCTRRRWGAAWPHASLSSTHLLTKKAAGLTVYTARLRSQRGKSASQSVLLAAAIRGATGFCSCPRPRLRARRAFRPRREIIDAHTCHHDAYGGKHNPAGRTCRHAAGDQSSRGRLSLYSLTDGTDHRSCGRRSGHVGGHEIGLAFESIVVKPLYFAFGLHDCGGRFAGWLLTRCLRGRLIKHIN